MATKTYAGRQRPKSEPKNVRTMQIWPGGKQIKVGEYRRTVMVFEGRETLASIHDGFWRKATDEERRAIRIEELAEKFQREGVLCCDSSLVGDLLNLGNSSERGGEQGGDIADEFTYDKVSNTRPDASSMDFQECYDYLRDRTSVTDQPNNPYTMTGAELCEAVGMTEEGDDGEVSDLAKEKFREMYIEQLDDGDIDGLKEWREAVNDNTEDAEIYEWWRVNSWLAGQLNEVGECVLDNNYGYWWGRCCTGQSMIMDGTFQKIASAFLNKYPDPV